ncbi:MAG TPA: hypothetical protein VIF62_27970 [Labilithrix sp.]|jgi:hypothetical protein
MNSTHLALCFAAVMFGCSGTSRSGFDSNDPGAPGAAGSSGGGSSGALGSSGTPGSSGAPAGDGKTLLYAHTDTTLFQADPDNLTAPLTRVGDFDCVGGKSNGSMTDLAVTKDGKLFGVSEGAAYPLTISGTTVHCEATWSLPQTKFYGLTVAPENTVAKDEVLIAADGMGGLYQIDQSSGTPTQVGTLGTDPKTGQTWALSGDVVFMANGGSPIGFATVRTCPKGQCASADTLIEVDVSKIAPGTQSVMKGVRGTVVRGSWCTSSGSASSYGSMFGIVAYKDKVFGFSRSGDVIEIHNTDGTGCLIQSDSTNKFAGAGITTMAPVVAPPGVN